MQGIEEEEQKALAKLPSIHTTANHVEEEGDKVEEVKWESMKRVNQEEEEEGRREVVTGKSLGVIAEDNFLGVKAEDNFLGVIAEDSDSAVHLDYSSDSLRSEHGRCERGDCGRGQFERGQFERSQSGRGQFERSLPSKRSSETIMERLPLAVTREGKGLFDQSTRSGCHFDRSTPVLKQRGLGLQRSVSDVVEAEFPSPFSDSRSHFG